MPLSNHKFHDNMCSQVIPYLNNDINECQPINLLFLRLILLKFNVAELHIIF